MNGYYFAVGFSLLLWGSVAIIGIIDPMRGILP